MTIPTHSIFSKAVAAGTLHYERMAEEIASAITDAYQEQLSLGECFGRELNRLIAAIPCNRKPGPVSGDPERFFENSWELLAEYVNSSSDLYARCFLLSQ
jgi:hypothetical protein